MKSTRMIVCVVSGLAILTAGSASAIDTTFSYQGRLHESGSPATGFYDFEFRIFSADSGGTQYGPTLMGENVEAVDGYFTAYLDFGAGVFDGQDAWLEVSVREGTSTGAYVILGPRQPVLASPYSLRSASISWDDVDSIPAGFADNIDDSVPPGAVMFFNTADCPTGWSAAPGASGRVIVGVNSGSTLSGTVGPALADLQPLAISESPLHSHTVDPPSSSPTSDSSGGHTHSVNPPVVASTSDSHNHSGSISSDGNHDHNIVIEFAGPYGTFGVSGVVNSNGGGSTSLPIANGGTHSHTVSTNNDSHNHSVDIPQINSSSHTGHQHNTTVDLLPFPSESSGPASVDITMPYIQLLVCEKD